MKSIKKILKVEHVAVFLLISRSSLPIIKLIRTTFYLKLNLELFKKRNNIS